MYKNLEDYRKYLAEDDRWAFLEKWNTAYEFSAIRKDVVDIIDIKPGMKILDIGCADGKTLKYIKENYPNTKLYGVEPDKTLASKADKYGMIYPVTIGKYLSSNKDKFDAIMMNDVIEHLKEPWIVVRETVKRIVGGGALYVSIPNFFHATVMYNLFECGSFGYRSNDIVNKEHLRYFTLNDSINLLKMAGLKHFRIYGNKVSTEDRCMEFTKKLETLFKRDYYFDVYQFVIKATM